MTIISLVMAAICAGSAFLYKVLMTRSWHREYRKQMDMRKPKPPANKPKPQP